MSHDDARGRGEVLRLRNHRMFRGDQISWGDLVDYALRLKYGERD